MGVLLVSDGTAAVQPRMNLNAVKATGAQRAIDIDNEANNNVNGLRDANSLMPTQVVGIIDVVVNDEPVRSWMPPPPKKKWIRHYLLGEPNFRFSSAFRFLEPERAPGFSVSLATVFFFSFFCVECKRTMYVFDRFVSNYFEIDLLVPFSYLCASS